MSEYVASVPDENISKNLEELYIRLGKLIRKGRSLFWERTASGKHKTRKEKC